MKKFFARFTKQQILIMVGIAAVIVIGIVLMAVMIARSSKAGDSQITEASAQTDSLSDVATETESDTDEESESVMDITEYMELEAELDESTENVEYVDDTIINEEATTDYPYYIKVNRQQNVVTVYAKDANGEYTVPVKAMLCSTGLNNNTPTGVFTTSTKYTWRALYGGVYGQYAYRFNGSILFHSVPYYTEEKNTLETDEFNKLGEQASMGCVRMAVEDVKWLIENCPKGTTVEVYDSDDPGPLGKPTAITIDWTTCPAECVGWDPTDPDPSNPWLYVAPTITVSSDLNLEKGTSFDLSHYVTAVDYRGRSVTLTIVSGSVDANTVGSYAISVNATDVNGNIKTESLTITVVDSAVPTYTLVSATLALSEANVTADTFESVLLANIVAKDGGITMDNASSITWKDATAVANLKAKIGVSSFDATELKFVITDESGNKTEGSMKVSYTYVDAPSYTLGTATNFHISTDVTESTLLAALKQNITTTPSDAVVSFDTEQYNTLWTKIASGETFTDYTITFTVKDASSGKKTSGTMTVAYTAPVTGSTETESAATQN